MNQTQQYCDSLFFSGCIEINLLNFAIAFSFSFIRYQQRRIGGDHLHSFDHRISRWSIALWIMTKEDRELDVNVSHQTENKSFLSVRGGCYTLLFRYVNMVK